MRNKEDLSNVHPKWFEKASKRHPSCPNEGGTKERKTEKLQNVFLLFRLSVLNAIVIKTSCLYTHRKSHRQRETKKKKNVDYHKQHISKLLIAKNTQPVFDFYNLLQLCNTIAPKET